MTKNIDVLDCTLRDGGRIIDCAFGRDAIIGIGKKLKLAGINIIEVGFLRDCVNYDGNSTFFASVSEANQVVYQICSSIPISNEKYVLFMDYGLYEISNLEEAAVIGVQGIRFGFTKKDLCENYADVVRHMEYIKSMGYDLYVQDVDTNGYAKDEFIELIRLVNKVRPISFGIVDTYGSMYLDDLEDIWKTIDIYLDKNIAIDFHSHNNMQMSFALAQRTIQIAQKKRRIIIDATLNGMGKCAGNLNTELIIDFLARKYDCDFDIDVILDAIDQYLFPIKKHIDWGYSVPAFMAGIYKAHPNNIIYLTEKYRLNSRDIKYIVSAIDEDKRKRYDYDNIARIYKKYCSNKIEDDKTIEKLRGLFLGKSCLVMAPGRTIEKYNDRICQYIKQRRPVVVCVNFVPQTLPYDYLFYANTIYWEKISDKVERSKCILVSNVHSNTEDTYLVGYSRLMVEDSTLYDNSTMMLLNLLKCIEVKEITLAGFDGLREKERNYVNDTFPHENKDMSCEEINKEIKKIVKQYRNKVIGKIEMKFLTPSIYEDKE